jgi:vacuolar protein sorting-associated protein 35
MLDILKTSKLTPSNYYHLYTTIFDEMQYIYNYFREESKRGRTMKDLYDVVFNNMKLLFIDYIY